MKQYTYRFAVDVFEKSMVFRVLVNHKIKVLATLWILNIEPYFLSAFAPLSDVSFFNIGPNLLKFFVRNNLVMAAP